MNKKISLILPIFNVEIFLQRCLQSIVGQDYPNIEIILINDGSTDQSGSICDEFAKSDKRIKVIHKQNQGVSAARNQGIKLSTGDYCCFIDSDDYIEPNFVSTMIHYLEKYSGDLVCCSCIRERKDGYIEWRKGTPHIRYYNHLEAIEVLFSQQTFGGWPWNKIYRTSIIKNNNLLFREDLRICEDEVFILDYLLYSEKTIFIPNELYHYMVNANSVNLQMISIKIFDYNYLNRLKADQISWNIIKNIGSKELLRTVKARFFFSNLIIMGKFINHYNGDKKTYNIIHANLRKYWWSYLKSPNYKKTVKDIIKYTLYTISPLLYNRFIAI